MMAWCVDPPSRAADELLCDIDVCLQVAILPFYVELVCDAAGVSVDISVRDPHRCGLCLRSV